MDVGGTHGVAVHDLEEIPRGAVGGKAVGGGVEAVEPVLAVLVGAELATEVVGGLVVGVLEVVLSVGRRLPDVEDGAGDGLARGDVTDHTVHLGDAALGGDAVLDDAAAELTEGSVGRPEGAENGRRRGVDLAIRNDLVGNLVDKADQGVSQGIFLERYIFEENLRLEAEDIRDTVSLVTGLLAVTVDLADSVDKVDTGHPLVDCELNLAGKVVEVADQRSHNDTVTLGGVGAHAINDGLSKVGVKTVSRLGGLGAVGTVGCHYGGVVKVVEGWCVGEIA